MEERRTADTNFPLSGCGPVHGPVGQSSPVAYLSGCGPVHGPVGRSSSVVSVSGCSPFHGSTCRSGPISSLSGCDPVRGPAGRPQYPVFPPSPAASPLEQPAPASCSGKLFEKVELVVISLTAPSPSAAPPAVRACPGLSGLPSGYGVPISRRQRPLLMCRRPLVLPSSYSPSANPLPIQVRPSADALLSGLVKRNDE